MPPAAGEDRDQLCDLVMKGGLTSGIAYPKAIDQLRRTYRFRNIGGASAGAIAAAATAAAEYGRGPLRPRGGARTAVDADAPPPGGFAALATLGDELTMRRGADGETTLQGLFQPTPKARPAFDLLLDVQAATSRGAGVASAAGDAGAATRDNAGAGRPGWWERVTHKARLVGVVLWGLRRLWWTALLGAAVALVIIWAAAGDAAAMVAGVPSVIALIVALIIGALLGLLVGVIQRARTLANDTVPDNFNGMCTGMPVHGRRSDGRPAESPAALTEWLHAKLQHLSGKHDGPPLTFADLAEVELSAAVLTARDDPGVQLQMMATDVTLARPLRLPIEDPATQRRDGRDDGAGSELDPPVRYFYSPQDFARLFPEAVVAYLRDERVSDPYAKVLPAASRPSAQFDPTHERPRDAIPDDLRTLPYDDLPVLVATRISLAFPVLLSAVPLYTYRAGEDKPWVRHWLSDGGIGSNFPIHFFDSLIPRWPTLALRFVPRRDGAAPVTGDESQPPLRDLLDPERVPSAYRTPIGSLFGFLGAILDTMQNWTDTLQSELPGFRDRIRDIPLAADEGGMNLAMDQRTITNVQDKGEAAGRELAQFDWPTHRFMRYMLSMRLLDVTISDERLDRAFCDGDLRPALLDPADPAARRVGDADLVERLRDWYPVERCLWSNTRTRELLTLVRDWSPDGDGDGTPQVTDGDLSFRGRPWPRPPSVLRIAPRV